MAKQLPRTSRAEHSLVIIVFFVCVGVTAALTILGGWHVYLVSLSETTIEFYTNKRDAVRMKKEGQVWWWPFYLTSSQCPLSLSGVQE